MTREHLRRIGAIVFALVWVGLVPLTALAQSVSFSSIVVVGTQRIEDATVISFAAIPLRTEVTPAEINDGYQRLIASGLFEEVEMKPRGNRLVIEVREFPTINRINIERNKKLKDDDLEALLLSQQSHTYSPAVAEADAAAIVEAYRQIGRYSAEVKPVIIRRADNRVDLVFEVFEGKTVEIQRLSFVGNRVFSDRRLRRALVTKQAGLLRAFFRSDTYVADRIAFDRQALTDFYLARGYIDFTVLSVASEIARERNGFFLTFKVREGQKYSFGEITTTSQLAEVDADEYQELSTIKSSSTYSPSQVENVISRMEIYASKQGLNFVRVEPRVVRHDDNRTLDIEFVILRGPRVFVERIDIEGNSTTLDRVIRRQFNSVEGDPFNPREIREAAERIRALGFFASSEVNTREGSSPDRVVVDVDVEEQPTGTLSFGASYSSSDGAGISASMTEKNFLGRGQYFKAEIGLGGDNQNTIITFAEPAMLDRNVRFEVNLYERRTTQQSSNFDTYNLGANMGFEFPVSENGRFGIDYGWSYDRIFNVGSTSPLITASSATTSVLGMSYEFSNVAGGLNPGSGMYFEAAQDLAIFGGTNQYSKTTAKIGAVRANDRTDFVFSAELEGGFISSLSGGTRITDRFFTSNENFRGFARNGIGPRDNAASTTDAIGGNAYAIAHVEASFPLGLPEEYGIFGGVFWDVGSVWSLDSTAGFGGAPVDAGMHLRSAVGVSIFWDTFIGPLRFNFAFPIMQQSYDVTETFSFTLDSRF